MGTPFSLSKSTTLGLLDASEWSLLVFGAVLVVGLVIEYRSAHGSRLMKFGELLVIIGVVGELMGDGGIFFSSRHLQIISDSEIRELTIKLGTANTLAEGAAKASQIAQDKADSVQRKADALGQQLSGLEVRSDQIRQSLGDRVFIDRQGAALRLGHFRQALLPRQTMLKVRLEYLTTGCGDECKQLADQFKRVLGVGYANWWVFDEPIANRNREQFFEGVSVHTRCDPSNPAEKKWLSEAAIALVNELNNKQHIKASRKQDECFDQVPGQQLEMLIRVGWKLGPSIPPRR